MAQVAGSDQQLDTVQQGSTSKGSWHVHQQRIRASLRDLGAAHYDMWLPETSVLPQIIHPGEQLTGIVFGRSTQVGAHAQDTIRHRQLAEGRGALVVTDLRVLFIDSKPLFTRFDEIPHDDISDVTYSITNPICTVTISTRSGDFSVRTFNSSCAETFMATMEKLGFPHNL